ncbi:MAG: DUF2029 domain-containing protein [Planctomycetales bacterium]|nr:DUF2029 domain-containing protein [Planctomycetales bacterium]
MLDSHDTHNAPIPSGEAAARIQFVSAAVLVVFLLAWVASFYPFNDWLDVAGRPLGADFSMFYVAGQVVWDGASEQLYNQAEHQQRLQQLFPGIAKDFALPYRYPPVVALLAAPLAALPYPVAYFCFTALSIFAWRTAVLQIIHACPTLATNWLRTFRLVIYAWPVALETLVGGQASMLALLIAISGFAMIAQQRFATAGIVLALASYKPNVLAILILALIVRSPRILWGLVPTTALVALLCLIPNGIQGISDYRELASQLASGTWDLDTPQWKVHGLANWFAAFDASGRLWCTAAGAALAVCLAWRMRRVAVGNRLDGIFWSTLISINALFNSYTPIYDLVMLSAGTALTLEYALSKTKSTFSSIAAQDEQVTFPGRIPACSRNVDQFSARDVLWAQLALAAAFFGPHASQAIAKGTGWQVFNLILLAATVWQAQFVIRGTSRASQCFHER